MTSSFALMDASPQRLDWHVWSGQEESKGKVAPRAELTRAVAEVEAALEGRRVHTATSTATNERESSWFNEVYAAYTVVHISAPSRPGLMQVRNHGTGFEPPPQKQTQGSRKIGS
jgi:hypothetical protein